MTLINTGHTWRAYMSAAPIICILFVLMAQSHYAYASLLWWPRREYISINTDVYEISAARNGSITINMVDRTPVFYGAGPRVLYQGEKRFKRLNTDARNAMRIQVQDALGQGQGLSFYTRNCEWHLAAYPAQSFFSVRLLYKNTGQRPVTIAALAPWYISGDARGAITLGAHADQVRILANSEKPGEAGTLHLRRGNGVGHGMLAARNAAHDRVLLAGFLTHNRADTYIQLQRDTDAKEHEFSHFAAVCVFDPPVTVPPGDTLETEALYISVGDSDMFAAVNGFSSAVASVQGLQPRRPEYGSGLSVGMPRYPLPISMPDITRALEYQHRHLADWGWTHFTIGRGWEKAPGNWALSSEHFPDGFEGIQKALRMYGFSSSIHLRPFLVAKESPLAQSHQEWLVDYAHSDENGLKVLNVGREDVRVWLTHLARTFSQTHGFDALIANETDCLFSADFSDDMPLTRIQLYRQGLAALREGLPENGKLIVSPWHPAALPYTDAIPISADTTHGEEHSTTPLLFSYGNPLLLGNESFTIVPNLRDISTAEATNHNIATITAAAMLGGAICLAEKPDALGDIELALLRRTWPPLAQLGFPLQITLSEDYALYYTSIQGAAGPWGLVACFNLSTDTETVLSVEPGQLGMVSGTPYALYDFISGIYHGLVYEACHIALEPAAVRLFGMRPYNEKPIFLSSERHLSQGATDHQRIDWDADSQSLTGTMKADPVPYRLRFLVPPGWEVARSEVSVGGSEISRVQQDIYLLRFSSDASQTLRWTVHFNAPDARQTTAPLSVDNDSAGVPHGRPAAISN